jgi:hypothetical protein
VDIDPGLTTRIASGPEGSSVLVGTARLNIQATSAYPYAALLMRKHTPRHPDL